MTKKEFDNQKWGVNMFLKHKNYNTDCIFQIATVVFPEGLVGVLKYPDEEEQEITYFRFENIELVINK